MEEVWKDVLGYEGYYKVSSFGRVKSIPKTIKYKDGRIYSYPEKIKSNAEYRGGYHMVNLKVNQISHNAKVHRLVAEAFIPNPHNKPTVNHINSIRKDNRVENLEWCTMSENNLHAFRIGKRKPVKNFGANNANSKPVLQFDLKYNFIAEYESVMIASRLLKIDNSSICKVCKNIYKTAGGCIWKFK